MLAAAAALCLGTVASAQDACAPKALDLYANFETLSVYLPFEGDANANASAAVAYREAGTERFLDAQPLARIKGDRFAGSIFGLKPGREYEVRVTVTDADAPAPVVLTAKAATRTEAFPAGTGATICVSPAGDDAAPGTKAQPFRTIQHAVDQAKPGDAVVVAPGVYRESVRVRTSGRADAYLTVRGEPGARLVGFPAPRKAAVREWTQVEGDLYKATPGHATRYVAVDGARLYYWKDLDGLKRGSEEQRGKAYSVKGGWTQEKDGTLYARLPDGGDPENAKEMQVTNLAEGIVLEGVRHVIVEGLDIGPFGSGGITLRSSSECVIRGNVIRNIRSGLTITGPESQRNVVERNELYETSVWDWPWQMCKAHDPEGSAIVLTAGRGTVVRHNRIHGFFNAIVPSLWGRLGDERFNGDMDAHDNEMWDIGDDCIEPEGTCINQRYWNNRMRGALMGISLAPITVGPCWFIRNTVFDHHLSAVKLDSDSTGPCFLYHNTFVTTVTKTDKYSTRTSVNGIGNSGAYHNLTFRNNIIQGTDYAYCDWRREQPKSHSMDYDDLFTTSATHFFMFAAKRYATFRETQEATGFEKNGMNADAQFVDLAKGDLRLKPESPLTDRGVRLPNVNDDFKGNAPDIGANECR